MTTTPLAAADTGELARELRAALREAARDLVGREVLVDLVALAAVAREHLLVIGPPGTAKSEAVRRVARVFSGRYFEYLLGRFTEPNEIFGAIDLAKLRAGTVETDVRGMLPEADLAFLDEVFQGSTAILNTLLGILNERTFTRGHTRIACPLRVCVGASNALPADESLAAFADRFLLRVFVEGVPDPGLEDLLEAGWRASQTANAAAPAGAGAGAGGGGAGAVSLALLDELARRASAVALAGAQGALAQAVRQLRGAGVTLSDRRIVRAQRLVAAAAALDGRSAAAPRDLWPLVYVVPSAAEQAQARDVLRDLLAGALNDTLGAAALDASQGLLARAARLGAAAAELLERAPETDADGAAAAWRWQLEGLAREIDATFAAENMPETVRAARERLRAALVATGLGGRSPTEVNVIAQPPLAPDGAAASVDGAAARVATGGDRAIMTAGAGALAAALEWRPRFPPLEPTVALARGAAAQALARALAAWPDDRLACLRGGAGARARSGPALTEELLVLAAPARELPWTDGVAYFGVDDVAPRLRLPTALAPSWPPDLLERVLFGRAPAAAVDRRDRSNAGTDDARGPLAIVPAAEGFW